MLRKGPKLLFFQWFPRLKYLNNWNNSSVIRYQCFELSLWELKITVLFCWYHFSFFYQILLHLLVEFHVIKHIYRNRNRGWDENWSWVGNILVFLFYRSFFRYHIIFELELLNISLFRLINKVIYCSSSIFGSCWDHW